MALFHLRLLLLSALVLPPRLSVVAMQAAVKGLERSPGVLLAQAPLLADPAIPVKVEVWVDGAFTAYKRRDTATALRLQKQVVAWLKANRPRLDEFRAISLLRLGVLLSEEGKSQEALVQTEEAVSLYRELAKTNPSFLNDLAGSLNNLGVQCSQYGRRHEALVATEEAVKIRRELVKSNPAFLDDLASSLNNLGMRYNELSRRQEALSPTEEAVKIYRELVRTNQAFKGDLALALINLGVLYTDMGRHQEALAPTEEAVKIYREQVRTNQAFKGDLARSLNNLGARYIELGRRQEALAPTEEAVKIRRELSKSNSVYLGDLASSLSNLGIGYSDLNRHQEALAPTEEAVKIHRELAKTNPAFLGGLANSLTLLGISYSELGRRQEALPPSEEAVKIYREQAKTNPAFQGDLAVSLNNLGNRYNELGRRQEALAPTEEAVKIRRSLAETNPAFLDDLASSLNNLGATYSTMARLQEALSPTEEAVKIYREQSKTNSAFKTAFAHSATNLAILQLQLANLSAALPLLRESVIMDMTYLQGQLPLLPEGRRLALVELFSSRWQIPFSHAQQGEAGASLAMFTRLNRQGLLQAIQRSQALLARNGPHRPLFEQLSAVIAQLANTTLTPQQQAPLLARKEQLEQELYRQLPQIHPKLVEPRQVAAVLPAGGLLVEFQRYYPHDASKNWEQGFESPRYLALLLRPDGTIRAIPLGEAALIDTAIRAAVAASADANQQANAAKKLAAVSRLVLEPLKRELMGVRELFISPDGELNRLPFAALPVAVAKADGLADGLITPDGPTLGDAVALRLLTTGRDLLWLRQPTMAGGAPVLIANPDFNNAHLVWRPRSRL